MSETPQLMHESVHLAMGEVLTVEHIFAMSNPKVHAFYYVKAGWDAKKYQKWIARYKKTLPQEFVEVWGFKNLDNAKMEYHFNYLLRIQAPKHCMHQLQEYWLYNSEIVKVQYSSTDIEVPEDNDEALQDRMQVDFLLPGMMMKPKTREHFADIMSGL